MSVIPVKADFLLGLLDEVGKSRALSDIETDILHHAVKCENSIADFQWTPELEKMLEAAARRKSIGSLARSIGISEGAAHQKLHRMRRRKGRKVKRIAGLG